MDVSVVIPVFNAARFLESAVASALEQPETKEIILIEDGSKDNSYSLCKQLAHDPRIKLYTHDNHENKGAAASRNLGMRMATMPFIAFLDADDLYAPKRFETAREVLMRNPEADGVHEVIGAFYIDPEMKERHIARASGENTGIRISTPPDKLFRVLATGKYGHIHLNGVVLRRAVLATDDVLDTQLVMSEDSEFILRLAATKRMYSGDPHRIVAKRGVHQHNSVFLNPRILYYRRQYLQKCISQRFYGSSDLIAAMYIISRRVGAGTFYQPFKRLGLLALPFKLVGIAGYLIFRPAVIFNLISIAFK